LADELKKQEETISKSKENIMILSEKGKNLIQSKGNLVNNYE
jgi:hypothetical protein